MRVEATSLMLLFGLIACGMLSSVLKKGRSPFSSASTAADSPPETEKIAASYPISLVRKSRKLRAFQKDSYISLDYGNTALKVYRKKTPVIKSLKDVEYLSPKLSSTDPLRNEHQHFLDCIRHNRKPWPSGERGVEALKLALQISEELDRYELSGHAGSRSLIRSWAQDLGKIAKSVGKDILRS